MIKIIGVKYFEDELGIKKISELNAGKESKKQIEPIMFKSKDVFCSYYFNKHQLSPFEADTNQSNLSCVIYGIPKEWNMLCWLIDSLTTSLMKASEDKESIGKFSEIMKMLTDNFDYLKGPSIMKQQLSKLITRTCRKLNFIVRDQIYSGIYNRKETPNNIKEHWRVLGVNEQFIIKNIKNVNDIRKDITQESSLPSSFCQDWMEMLCTLLVPFIHAKTDICTINPKYLLDSSVVWPNWLENGVHLQILMNFFSDQGLLCQEILNNLVEKQLEFSEVQSESILLIDNLPRQWNKQEIRENILSLAQKNKLRVLNPSIDLQIFGDTVILLVDGVATLDLEEVALEKKLEEEEKLKELEMETQSVENIEANVPAHPDLWDCESCTLQNPWDSLICDVCESPKPENISVPQANKQNQAEKIEVEDQCDPIENILLSERYEIHSKITKFLKNVKSCVTDYYIEKKDRIQKDLEQLERDKAEALAIHATNKARLEVEIQKQTIKEQKKQHRLDIQAESKRKRKHISAQRQMESKEKVVKTVELCRAMPTEPKPSIQNDSKIDDQNNSSQKLSLKQLHDELKEKESSFELLMNEVNQNENSFKNEIQIFESLQNSCITLQGQNQILSTKDQDYLNKFLKTRFFEEDSQRLRFSLIQRLEQRCRDLPLSFLQSLNITDSKSMERILTSLLESNRSIDAVKLLAELGIDIHLDFVFHTGDKKRMIPVSSIAQLIKFVEVEACKETKHVLKYNANNIRFHSSSYTFFSTDTPIGYSSDSSTLPYKKLTQCSLAEIRFTWGLLKVMNKILERNVLLINMGSKEEALDHQTQIQKNRNGELLHLSISNQLSEYRTFWMSPIKIELSQRVLNLTAIKRNQVPKVQVERLKLQRSSEAQKTPEMMFFSVIPHQKPIVASNQKDFFLFTSAFDQIKDVPVTLLRPMKPTGTDPFIAFEIIFKGELVMGEAGPYRQFFADISSELQANILQAHDRELNLLLPSTNNLSKIGDSRDKYVVNPSAKSSYQLQLFEFLGLLMGTCVRTGTHLTLDLPQIMWKQLVNQEITLDDLEEIDRPVFDMIKFIDSCEKSVFSESFFETYTTTLSDLSTIELKKNGSKITVTYEDRHEYMARIVDAKIRESSLQIQAIKRGLNQIIPASLLNTVLSTDLEMWVCGRKRVDFDLLRRHTIYSASLNESTPHIQFLWKVLHELTHTEALRFIKFCWGQERLPANDEEFERNQIRFMIKPATYSTSQPNKALPKADTCFFNLELPAYTTKTALYTQLLIAINTDCDSMNAEDPIALDPNPNNYAEDNDNYTSEDDYE